MPTVTGNAVKSDNSWDLIADRFNTHKSLDEIHPDAAVNIYVGWPVFFEHINYQKHYLGREACEVLDFGCGAGEFCKKIHMHGHNVVGMDKSRQMISIAQENSPKEIRYIHVANLNSLDEYSPLVNKMDIVTSIHVFDWIENVEEVIKPLAKVLVSGGLLMFSVFPKKHVIDSIRIKDLFEDFDSNEDPYKGVCNFDGVKIPVYVRDPPFYDKLFDSLGFEKVLEYTPPYPLSFIKKYKWSASMCPEMLVLSYRKL